MHQQTVPGRLSVLQTVNGDSSIETPWAFYLQPIGKEPDLNMASTDELAIISMSYRIDYCLSNGYLWILRYIPSRTTPRIKLALRRLAIT